VDLGYFSALLCDDSGSAVNANEDENGGSSNNNNNKNEERSNTDTSFWGDEADDVDDDEEDGEDDSSASSAMEDYSDVDFSQSQSTGQEILSIAIPALAGLAIDPLMVR